MGILKGEVRGYAVYGLTNFANTPAALANAICTSSFGIAEQLYLLRKNEIDEKRFLSNSEVLCLNATVSTLSNVTKRIK